MLPLRYTASALTIMRQFGLRGKVRCHNDLWKKMLPRSFVGRHSYENQSRAQAGKRSAHPA